MSIVIFIILWVICAIILSYLMYPIEDPYRFNNIPKELDTKHKHIFTFISLPLIIVNFIISAILHLISFLIVKVLKLIYGGLV